MNIRVFKKDKLQYNILTINKIRIPTNTKLLFFRRHRSVSEKTSHKLGR